MIDSSKRKFLRNSAGMAASTAALSLFPPSIRRALAIPANNRTGTIRDVEHVVILMQENRSFDNYFGTLSGVRGFGDRHTIPVPNGLNVFQQRNGNGRPILPYHLDQSSGNAQRVSGTPHSWIDARDAWNKGRMFEWPRYKEPQSMGYFTEQEIPYQVALANAFTLCDGYFCSLHGGTNSNRLFHWSGTNGATVGDGKVVVNNVWDSLNSNTNLDTTGFSWTTYPERLEAAGVSWMVYQNMPDNFTDNPLVGFKQYRQANLASGKPVYHNRSNAQNPAYDHASDNTGNPLYKGIANTMPDNGMLGAFRDDIRAGKLAQVTWIMAPAAYSEHPGSSSPVQGGWYLQEVLDALTENPDVWSKTALLVNFDENDGYFDHYPPPCAPSLKGFDPADAYGKTTMPVEQVASEYYLGQPIAGTNMPVPDGDCFGPGPRVPMYVISPWSRGGWINSQHFDHTSVLRFLETRFGVAETNISPFRRAIFGDLTSAFNFATPNDAPLATLGGRKTRTDADQLRNDQAQLPQVPVPSTQTLPRQAPGIRPSRALPYELHTSARCDLVNGVVRLIFSNTGTQASVFHVYDKLNLDRPPRRYMVEAGKQLDDAWDAATDNGGRYSLWVLGPNGFHRAFTGDLSQQRNTQAPDPEVRVCYDITNGNIELSLMNAAAVPVTLHVSAMAYRHDGPWRVTVAAGGHATLPLDLAVSDRWYDFQVSCPELPGYGRRFAGRIETGADGVTDPAMGLESL